MRIEDRIVEVAWLSWCGGELAVAERSSDFEPAGHGWANRIAL